MYKYFFGSFNKARNHRDCEYLKNECGVDYDFDEKFYNEIACKIKNILGNFEVYRVQDVFHYFQLQYAAYPIDIRYYYNYVDTSIITGNSFKKFTISNDTDIDALSEPCGSFYSYVISENDKNDSRQEETLFLVIDIIGNRFLRERYPEISAHEEKVIQLVKGIQKDNEGINWLNYLFLAPPFLLMIMGIRAFPILATIIPLSILVKDISHHLKSTKFLEDNQANRRKIKSFVQGAMSTRKIEKAKIVLCIYAPKHQV